MRRKVIWRSGAVMPSALTVWALDAIVMGHGLRGAPAFDGTEPAASPADDRHGEVNRINAAAINADPK
jgi:hypothetical protein